MKPETAFQAVRLLLERKKGFVVELHASPEGEIKIKRQVTIKDELNPREIVEKLIQQ